MQVSNSVALVTGANRGLGRAFIQALLARGARKVYAAARNPGSIDIPGVVPLKLDVTSADDIAAAVAAAPDLTLLINNAGISRGTALLATGALDAARAELETNVLAPIGLSAGFAPALARNGGGAIINVLSALSWINIAGAATYSASKAAAWSVTNGLRGELRGQGTQVIGLHLAYMDTDMARHVTGPKVSPEAVAAAALDGLEAGQVEVLADGVSQQVKQNLSAGVYLQPR
jgi:NAD(P)-dependent dehydrogenase (short-subunit alcohol dehydrogenase family)